MCVCSLWLCGHDCVHLTWSRSYQLFSYNIYIYRCMKNQKLIKLPEPLFAICMDSSLSLSLFMFIKHENQMENNRKKTTLPLLVVRALTVLLSPLYVQCHRISIDVIRNMVCYWVVIHHQTQWTRQSPKHHQHHKQRYVFIYSTLCLQAFVIDFQRA